MDLNDLSVAQRMNLCLRAEEACIRRLQELSESAEQEDSALQDLLGGLEAEERRHLQVIRPFVEETPEVLDPGTARRLIGRHFPSFSRGFGEGRLDRDIVMHFAECLEEEASRFHRAVAEGVADEETALALKELALGEWGTLERLRTVLL